MTYRLFFCSGSARQNCVIALKIGTTSFTLSLSKGRSWFDKPVLSEAEGLTTNGTTNANRYENSRFHPRWCRVQPLWQMARGVSDEAI